MSEESENVMTDESIESELRTEIEHYLKEKEKIRAIIGQIGGKFSKQERLINIIFVVLVLIAFGVAIFVEDWKAIPFEIAILLVSLKLAFLLSQAAKVNHFQFWMLSSIEWRLNDIGKRVAKVEKQVVPEDPK